MVTKLSEEQTVSIQDQLQTAIGAEQKGIPVDWKTLCIQVYNVAMAEIKRLTDEAEPELPPEE